MAPKNVVIVGSGVFGMSTALWMLDGPNKGKYAVTILEKCETVPAPDAASTDINKIVRAGDYADPHLAKLSVDAIDFWRRPEWDGTYHESGVMCLSGNDPAGRAYVDSSYNNCKNMNLGADKVSTPSEIKAQFHKSIQTGPFENRSGYMNHIGGWAESGRAIEVGLARVAKLGAKIRAGAEVVSFQKEGKKVTGVVLKSGEKIPAELVVVAAGAWTPSLLANPSVNMRMPEVVATGQTVAMIKLTPEKYEIQKHAPVVFNLDTGYYIFPPTKDGIVKMAIHAAGFTNCKAPCATTGKNISIPRTKLTPGAESGAIPVEALRTMRLALAAHYPALANKPFADTRLCWYCDTVTGDWLVDYHPDYDNLFLATGGSGHAFKFAPNVGREVLALIERTGNSLFQDRFSFQPTVGAGADVRNGVRKEIVEGELCQHSDMVAGAREAGRL